MNHLRVFLANALNQFAVNATVMLNTLKITLFSASGKRDVPTFFFPSRLTFAQAVNNFVLLRVGHFCVENVLPAEIIWRFLYEIALNFFVRGNVNKGKNKFFGAAKNLVSDVPNTLQQISRRKVGRNYQRVKTPYNTLFTNLLRKFFECFDALFKFRDTRLEFFVFVVVHRKLEIIFDSSLVQFGQKRNYRRGIFCPKNYELAVFQRNIHRLLVERIVPNAISRLQTVEKPFGKKGRNVGRARGGNNDGSSGIVGNAVLVGYGEFSWHFSN